MLVNELTCNAEKCIKATFEYAEKRDRIVTDFAIEKERLLKPWLEKMNTEIFLLDREYFKFKKPSKE